MMMHGGGRGGRRGRGRPDLGPGGPGFGPDASPEEEGFGPGGRGFGPGGPGFGPGFGPPGRGFGMRMGPGPGGPGFGPRGHRRRIRGDVRAAVLALLAEEPRHGYAIMSEITERSGGVWRPSPGSVYPVLQQLQDEGLVSVTESEGRRVFSLTEAGAAYVEEYREAIGRPWEVADSGPGRRMRSLAEGMAALGAAVHQVARLADDAQAARAAAALEEARRTMYRILAGDDVAGPRGGPATAAGAQGGPGTPGSQAPGGGPADASLLTHEPASDGPQDEPGNGNLSV
jgi:DNA-binding PadR family transcriptional regulator